MITLFILTRKLSQSSFSCMTGSFFIFLFLNIPIIEHIRPIKKQSRNKSVEMNNRDLIALSAIACAILSIVLGKNKPASIRIIPTGTNFDFFIFSLFIFIATFLSFISQLTMNCFHYTNLLYLTDYFLTIRTEQISVCIGITVGFSAEMAEFATCITAFLHCFFYFFFTELMITMFANVSFQLD